MTENFSGEVNKARNWTKITKVLAFVGAAVLTGLAFATIGGALSNPVGAGIAAICLLAIGIACVYTAHKRGIPIKELAKEMGGYALAGVAVAAVAFLVCISGGAIDLAGLGRDLPESGPSHRDNQQNTMPYGIIEP